MSAEEYQARLATALQWPGRQQVYAYEDVATGMMSFPAPTPVLQFGNMDTTGRIRPNASNAAGESLVEETNSAANLTALAGVDGRIVASSPLTATAWGAYTTIGWRAAIPVNVLADGAGAIGAAVEVVAASAGVRADSEWTLQVDTTGTYLWDFIQATGAPVASVPDYNSVPVAVPMVAGYPYKIRIGALGDTINLGVNAMPNGSFPNNATMTLIPMFRYT